MYPQVSLHLWDNGAEILSSHSAITSERGRGCSEGCAPSSSWVNPGHRQESPCQHHLFHPNLHHSGYISQRCPVLAHHHHPVHCSQQCLTISTPASTFSVPARTTLKHLDPPAESCISRTYQPVSPCPSQPHHPVCASKHHHRAFILASITLSLPRLPHCLCQSEMNNLSLEDPPHNWTGLFIYTHTVGLCSQLQARAEGTLGSEIPASPKSRHKYIGKNLCPPRFSS